MTMADTVENQKEYPQQQGQLKGCGFPIMRCVMLFCLGTGGELDIATAPFRGKQTGENSLLQTIIGLLFLASPASGSVLSWVWSRPVGKVAPR